jgi:hypothetical protein
MKNKMTLTQQQAKIQEFADLCQQGIDAWTKAGEIIVELVESDPSVFDKIIQFNPAMDAGILGKFEMIGRKVLHPHLLINDSPGFIGLSEMPFSVQERFMKEPIPLIIETDNGTDTLLVDAKNMTRFQARQAFGKGRIRTEGEQKAWLMDQRSKKAKPCGSNIPAWVIRGGRVQFNEGATLSAGELATIITQLTK